MTRIGILQALRNLNRWLDEFLIELSRPLLLLGFICATVDLLTSGRLAITPWFSYAWAVVQAVAIDGLFFAVWAQIKRTSDRKRLALLPVGVGLSLVVFFINGVLTLQQVQSVASSVAMQELHIDPSLF